MTKALDALVASALAEDLGMGDLTADALVSPERMGHGRILAKESGVVAGLEPARRVFSPGG